jgi:hypothetical protein
MKSIYLSLFIIFLFSCGNPESSEKEKTTETKPSTTQKLNIEVAEIISHGFYINKFYNHLDYNIKVKLINKSGYKLTQVVLYNKINISFPKKPLNLTGGSNRSSQFDPPWLPNDTINFDFDLTNINPDYLDYNPDTVNLFMEARGNDIIGNDFSETYAIYNIMDDWAGFQKTYKNKQN